MVSETVKQVLAAEEKADGLVIEAKARAGEISEKAHSDAEDMLRESLAAAEKECEKLRAENESRIEGSRRASAEECRRREDEIKRAAEQGYQAAERAVTDFLFERNAREGG